MLFSEVLKKRNWVETQVGRDATGGAKEFTSPRLPYSEGVFNLQGDKNINVVEKNWIYINGIKIYKIYTKLQPRKPLANGYF